MQNAKGSQAGFITPRAFLAFALLLGGLFLAMFSVASTPSSGTLDEAHPSLIYTAGPFPVANQSPLGAGQLDTGPRCSVTFPCDNYALTVSLPAGYGAAHPNASVRVSLSWTDTGSGNSDYDLYVYQGTVGNLDGNTPAPYQGGGQDNPEVASIFPIPDGQSTFSIKVVPYTPTAEIVTVRIELLSGSGDASANPNFGGPDPTVPGMPRYQTFYPPVGSSAEAGSGEFNIGFNPATGRMMLDNIGPVWRLTPPEVAAPTKPALPECCTGLWEDKSSTVADKGLDPILWTDQKTGRTFASNATAGANAAYGYTDNDGDLWQGLAGVAPPNGGDDHQTIVSGPYPAGVINPSPLINEGQAVYYCSQTFPVGAAACQRSDTLGTSYGPGIVVYDGAPGCRALHGHMKVAPDGTLYLPVPDCTSGATSQNGFVRSTDGGVTWVEKYIPNSQGASRGSDSASAVDASGKVYYFYILETANGNEGHMYVQVSTNRGDTWTNATDLGLAHGIVNVAFPEGVAGDAGRAAVGFLGTDKPGNFQSIAFPGLWYAFIATTFDGGQTWVTTNVSPNDPVQGVGGIWQGGGGNENRNLLDFNEITLDDKGRPLFGYSDGCVGDCVANPAENSFTAHMRVARQFGGRTLLASQDAVVDKPGSPILPKPACLRGTRDPKASHLKWIEPDNGGADIINYQIFRGITSGGETLIGQTANAKTVYEDTTADPNVARYYYIVKAVNAVGIGAASNEISLTAITPPPCVPPSGPFFDDLEPGANAGWQVDTAANQAGPASPTWAVVTDSAAHSASHSFSSDAMTLALKDDRLIAPSQNVSATTTLTFWHSYGFEDGYDGGVLEVSTDFGATWVDVVAGGGSFISGGYNGSIDPGLGSPIAGRAAWTGGDAGAMTKVEVNLGSYAGINVMVRFRLVCDPIAPLSTPGIAWYIDDIGFSNLQNCPAAPSPTPTATPTATASASPTATASASPTATASATPTATASVSPTATASASPTATASASPTATASATPTATASASPTATASATPTATASASPTATASASPTATASATASPTPSATASATPTATASASPTPTATATTTPIVSPTPTATATASASATPTASPTATATPSATVTPTPTPTPNQAQLLNISTRARAQTGDNVPIAGFIITGRPSKKVLLMAKGPSINVNGVPVSERMEDPTLELRGSDGSLLSSNDDWRDAPNKNEIEASGLAPSDDRESAIYVTLAPGSYTAILRGKNNGTGISLIEAYDPQSAANSFLANISTRCLVGTGDDVLIGGFVAGSQTTATKVLVRAIGPSIKGQLPAAMDDPTLELHDSNGATLATNNNWKDDQQAEIEATGIPPSDDLESAIVRTLSPAAYTAIVRGNNNTTGVALVEIYNIR